VFEGVGNFSFISYYLLVLHFAATRFSLVSFLIPSIISLSKSVFVQYLKEIETSAKLEKSARCGGLKTYIRSEKNF